MEKFKKNDFKSGMVVEIYDGEEKTHYLGLIIDSLAGLCIYSENMWFPISVLDDSLYKNNQLKITKVYGKAYPRLAHKISKEGRKLLWSREED